MNKAKFTKGPLTARKDRAGSWEVVFANGEESSTYRGEEYLSFCATSSKNIDECICTGDTAKANAHLIAAAPEMYEMLQEMIEQYDYDGCTEYEYKMISSAKQLLAKARGE